MKHEKVARGRIVDHLRLVLIHFKLLNEWSGSIHLSQRIPQHPILKRFSRAFIFPEFCFHAPLFVCFWQVHLYLRTKPD